MSHLFAQREPSWNTPRRNWVESSLPDRIERKVSRKADWMAVSRSRIWKWGLPRSQRTLAPDRIWNVSAGETLLQRDEDSQSSHSPMDLWTWWWHNLLCDKRRFDRRNGKTTCLSSLVDLNVAKPEDGRWVTKRWTEATSRVGAGSFRGWWLRQFYHPLHSQIHTFTCRSVYAGVIRLNHERIPPQSFAHWLHWRRLPLSIFPRVLWSSGHVWRFRISHCNLQRRRWIASWSPTWSTCCGWTDPQDHKDDSEWWTGTWNYSVCRLAL